VDRLDRAVPLFPRREVPTLPRQVPESAGRGSRGLRADLRVPELCASAAQAPVSPGPHAGKA